MKILYVGLVSGSTVRSSCDPEDARAILSVKAKGIHHTKLPEAVIALPDCLEALQVIEQLTRGTLSTHVHNVAASALKKAGCV